MSRAPQEKRAEYAGWTRLVDRATPLAEGDVALYGDAERTPDEVWADREHNQSSALHTVITADGGSVGQPIGDFPLYTIYRRDEWVEVTDLDAIVRAGDVMWRTGRPRTRPFNKDDLVNQSVGERFERWWSDWYTLWRRVDRAQHVRPRLPGNPHFSQPLPLP